MPEVLEGRQLLASLTGTRPLVAVEASGTEAGIGTRTWTPRQTELQVDQGQTNWLRVATVTTNKPVGVATATIDWGDGVTTAGSTAVFAIDSASPGAVDTVGVDVLGEHAYTRPGTYVVQATIKAADGASTVVSSRVVVTSAPRLSGGLDPASDTGASNTDGITANPQPRFLGSAAPHASVQIVAIRAGAGETPLLIGQGVADGQGNWSIPSLTLTEGTYTIKASAVTADGRVLSEVALNAGRPLVVDTTGPRLAGLKLDPANSQVQITLADNLSGLDSRGAVGANAVVLQRLVRSRATAISVQPLAASDGGRSVVLALGQPLRNGRYALRIAASGVRDLAGNALDGEFGGSFATGNGQTGGDFAARFQVSRRNATPLQPSSVPVPSVSQVIRTRAGSAPGLAWLRRHLRTGR